MINILNLPKAPTTSEQVVSDANANNNALNRYIGIDINGKITKELKTTSDPLAIVQTSAQANTITTNPATVLVLDSTNKIGIRTNINLNALGGSFPFCDVVNTSGTNYTLSSTGTYQGITGPTQSGAMQDFLVYANGVVAYNSNDSYRFLIICEVVSSPSVSSIVTYDVYRNGTQTGMRGQALIRGSENQTITFCGIIQLQINDQLRVFATTNISATLTINIVRWTITKI